ncbi:hypothetical protein [Streptomyces albus]|uniref:hypothetical protein n=1 Tax=Streptomyces albus TaxID=1888 RepID=UPI0034555870
MAEQGGEQQYALDLGELVADALAAPPVRIEPIGDISPSAARLLRTALAPLAAAVRSLTTRTRGR